MVTRHSETTFAKAPVRPPLRDNLDRSGRRLCRTDAPYALHVKRLVAGAAALTLGACSAITNPYVIPGDELPAEPTFVDALDYAREKRKEMSERLVGLDQYETATGTIAFGSGIAALAFGIFRSHTDALLGAGLVGGSAYGASSLLPIADRKEIYAKGVAAISCAIRTGTLASDTSTGGGGDDDGTPPNDPSGMSSPLAETALAAPSPGNGARNDPLLGAIRALQNIDVRGGTGRVRSAQQEAAPSDPNTSDSSDNPASGGLASDFMTVAPTVFPSQDPVLIGRTSMFDARIADLQASTNRVATAKSAFESAAVTLTLARANRLIGATDQIIAATMQQLSKTSADPDAALKALKDHYSTVQGSLKKTGETLDETIEDAKDDAEKAETAAMEAEATMEQLSMTSSGTGQSMPEAARDAFSSRIGTRRQEIQAQVQLLEQADASASTVKSLVDSMTACLGGLSAKDDKQDDDKS
ncbi:MAG: hypothetical protein P1U88_04845 [Thalassobaculaceae bacterium]|nr:hypothetical protein [Thalassobaculaceae bacterium]